MVAFAKGLVVLGPFLFSDLSQSKLRPAVVLADAGHGDWILCQMTSKSYADPRAVQLDRGDFKRGSLRISSYARPGKLFTANHEWIIAEVGLLNAASQRRITDAVVSLLGGLA